MDPGWRMRVLAQRPQGTGSLFVRTDRRDASPGTRTGASMQACQEAGRAEAAAVERGEPDHDPGRAELRRLMESVTVAPTTMDLAEAGRRWLAHLETIGRRRSGPPPSRPMTS